MAIEKKTTKAVEPVEETKEVEQTATPAKKTTRKPAAKKTTKATQAKAEVAEVAEVAEKKAPAKKTTTRKPAAKKTTKKAEPVVNVFIEFDGGQEKMAELIENVKAVYAAKNTGVEIETLDIFVKPEDRKAYFNVNGELDSENQMDVYF